MQLGSRGAGLADLGDHERVALGVAEPEQRRRTLAARTATTDIVDACVVEGALRRGDLVISTDEGDLQSIAAATSHRLEIDRP